MPDAASEGRSGGVGSIVHDEGVEDKDQTYHCLGQWQNGVVVIVPACGTRLVVLMPVSLSVIPLVVVLTAPRPTSRTATMPDSWRKAIANVGVWWTG